MYPVCPPDCLLGLGLLYHWQCCRVEVFNISDFLVCIFFYISLWYKKVLLY